MALTSEITAFKYINVSANVPIQTSIPAFEESDMYVVYGNASLIAVRNVDFTVELSDDFSSTTITPTDALLIKITNLIADDPTESNFIVVRRTLDYLTEATADIVGYTPFTSDEFDRNAMRDLQLDERLNRALTLSDRFVGDVPSLELAAVTGGASLVFNDDASAIIPGPTALNIAEAGPAADRAEAAAAQLALYSRIEFDTVADLVADTTLTYEAGDPNQVVVGQIVYVRNMHAYTVEAVDATDNHLSNSRATLPVKYKLMRGENGMFNAQGVGAVADGYDNFDGYTHGENKLTGEKRALFKWTTGENYVEGDIVFDDTGQRGLLCTFDHTSGTLSSDVTSGFWVEGSFSGTDNNAVFALCLTHFLEKGLPVYWPAGKYRFADPGLIAVPSGGRVHNLRDCRDIFVFGEGANTEMLIDELPERMVPGVNGGSFFMATAQVLPPFVRTKLGEARIENIRFRGRWSHFPGGSRDDPNSMGVAPIRIEGFRKVSHSNCEFFDIRNKGARNKHNNAAVHNNVYGERCARGVVREVNTNHCSYLNCRAKHTDDDPFDANTSDERSDNAMHSTQFINIMLEDCESLICNSGHTVTMQNIVAMRSKAGAIGVARGGTSSSSSGRTPHLGISIKDVMVWDAFERFDHDTDALLTNDIFSGAVLVSGNKREGALWVAGTAYVAGAIVRSSADNLLYTTLAGGTSAGDDTDLDGGSDTGVTWVLDNASTWPGDWNGTEVVQPTDQPAGMDAASFMWNANGDTSTQGHGGMVTVDNLQVTRSVGVLPNYAAMGFGFMFTRQGWKNPDIGTTRRKATGLTLVFDLQDVHVVNSKFSNLDAGVSFLSANSSRPQDAFKNVHLHANQYRNMAENCILADDPGVACTWGLKITGSDFDLDPYVQHPRRNGNTGLWSAAAVGVSSGCAVFVPSNIKGTVLGDNNYRNALKTFHDGANNFSSYNTQTTFENQRLFCEPASSGGFDAASKGVAYVPRVAGGEWRLTVEGSDPTNYDEYKQLLNNMIASSADMPTSGRYVRGHFVADSEPNSGTVVAASGAVRSGWLRLTDGTGHVLDTDWVEV